VLDVLAKKYGFEVEHLAVDHPGQEQKATWLKIRQSKPDWIIFRGWGVMNQVGVKEAAAIGFKMDRIVAVWWSGTETDVVPAGDSPRPTSTFHAWQNLQVHRISRARLRS
jgi:branched-chain amino acid transport system substrate-binding protein